MAERQNFDTLMPDLRIQINGQEFPLDARADLIAVSILEDVNAAGMFTITLLCWDGDQMSVRWIDDDFVEEGNSVEIDMGYRESKEPLFSGEITGLEPEFPNNRPPTLTIPEGCRHGQRAAFSR